MSTVKATYLQHPSSASANITLNADGTVENVAGMGKVLQVASAIKTAVQSTTSTSFVDVTDLSVTITPSSATNKALVIATVAIGNSSTSTTTVQMLRDATVIGSGQDGFGLARTNDSASHATLVYLDSPATTSATTYKVQFRTSANTGYVNRSGATGAFEVSSTIAVIEVAA